MTAEAVAQAAHELRGALTAAALALQGGATADVVQVELDRAAVVVSDLDDTAPTHSGECDLRELVLRQAFAWRIQAAAAGREIDVDPGAVPLPVRGQPGRVAQVLGNLVANALEHGRGRVEVRVWPHGFSIGDEGDGLPASLEALAASPRGRRGRGLAVVSRIVASLGGSVAAEVTPGGARMVVELPAA